MVRVVLGVDGGNTKSVAVVVDEDGAVLGRGQSGCSDIYGAASLEEALSELDGAIRSALAESGCVASDLAASAMSLAGADWPEDFHLLREALRSCGVSRCVSVFNDAFAPLRAGSDDFTGVAVVCGTGATTGARSAAGQMWHASWWQDAQGARQLGHRALWAAFHAELGIGPPTSLTECILAAYEKTALESLLHEMTTRKAGRWETEPAAHVLVAEAEAGDPVARGLVQAHGEALGAYALVACRKVDLTPLHRLILDGTVLRRSALMLGALAKRVLSEEPRARVILPDLEPAAGAALLAMDSAGISVSREAREKLRAGASVR